MVINTDPGAGTKIIKGGRIEAPVSRGPERFSMPAVVGLTQEAARIGGAAGQSAVGKVKPKYSETVREGVVLSSSKHAGASLKRDTPSTWSSPADRRRSRSRTTSNQPAATAEEALTKAGFKVVIKTEHSDKIAKDRVISQDPRSGTGNEGRQGHRDHVAGPGAGDRAERQPDGRQGRPGRDADAGFKTKVQPAAVNYIGIGFVVYSNPRARTEGPQRLDDHPLRGLTSSDLPPLPP